MNLKNIDLFKYVNCPECGNPNIGNGECGIIIDKAYIRYCKCGFKVTIDETGKELIEKTNISQLDKNVNEDETLREFIKNSHKYFYERHLKDEDINILDEAALTDLVEHLDYLWTK